MFDLGKYCGVALCSLENVKLYIRNRYFNSYIVVYIFRVLNRSLS